VAEGERGFVLAQRTGGERALPVAEGMVLLSPARLCRHVLVCGATGSGKTETVLRLAWAVARGSEAPVFYLDGKGDRENAARFAALMAAAGRRTRMLAAEGFDGWRGRPHEIQGRMMAIVDYAQDGPASWYRDIAKSVVRLVCEHPDGPPRSSGEALCRMDLPALLAAHPGSSAARALSETQVNQVRLRYEAFFGQTRGALDGQWAWEDTSAAYVLLDGLTLQEETAGLARFLFEDFAHYFTTRKPRERFCVMIVDEFSALAGSSGMAARIEQARGFNTGLVLAPQVVAGMGEQAEAARILGSVETVICHRVNTPEDVIGLAGTRQAIEYSSHYDSEGPTGEGSTRIQHQFKVNPNDVRSLPSGEAFLISRGRAMRARIQRAPHRTPAEALAPAPEPETQPQRAAPAGDIDPRPSEPSVPVGRARSEKGVDDLPF
jgi:hypothetical protein